MKKKISIWLGRNYNRIVNSIAFYPALIALGFVLCAYLFIQFDFSATGKSIKSNTRWLSLKDATTARSIISTIVSGIISLTVFSFTLVMIILNQTASQMSNRILDELIGNRFQQVVLGIYIGTIMFGLFLLSTIRDIDSGIYIPSISTYFLIIVAIVDIFLFIYFLHFITQSVKYEVIIHRIYRETIEAMQKCCSNKEAWEAPVGLLPQNGQVVRAGSCGIYEGFNKKALLNICEKQQCSMNVLYTRGSFVYEQSPVIQLSRPIPEEAKKEVAESLYFNDNETISNNYFYGFRQLTEVALRALSPGVNDPGTAVQSLRGLAKLFMFRLANKPNEVIRSKNEDIIIITKEHDLETMFVTSILPIWDYGKNDRSIQWELQALCEKLLSIEDIKSARLLQAYVAEAMEKIKL